LRLNGNSLASKYGNHAKIFGFVFLRYFNIISHHLLQPLNEYLYLKVKQLALEGDSGIEEAGRILVILYWLQDCSLDELVVLMRGNKFEEGRPIKRLYQAPIAGEDSNSLVFGEHWKAL